MLLIFFVAVFPNKNKFALFLQEFLVIQDFTSIAQPQLLIVCSAQLDISKNLNNFDLYAF